MKTLYSQFELLALAYRKCKRSNREAIVGRGSQLGGRAKCEPALPIGYVHIRGAIQALMALTRSPGYIMPGDRSRVIRAA